jgi:hypothetical protein
MTTKTMLSLFTGLIVLWATESGLQAANPAPVYVPLPDQPAVNDEFILEIYQGDSLNQLMGVDTLNFSYLCDGLELDESSPFYLETDNSWFCDAGQFEYSLSLASDRKTISLQIIRTNGSASGYGHVCNLRGGIIVKIDEDISRRGLKAEEESSFPFPNPCQNQIAFPSSWLSSLSSVEIIFPDGKRKPAYPVGNQIDLSQLQKGYFILRFQYVDRELFFRCLKI